MKQMLSTVFALVLLAAPALASPITSTLDACVKVDDPRLALAVWFAPGTFQAVAFDDPTPGCDPTILTQIHDAYIFDENRVDDTLLARLNLDNLPKCGRRQYDLHWYLSEGVLDPMGLKSLVIDTGVACAQEGGGGGGGASLATTLEPPPVPEPATLLLTMTGALVIQSLRLHRARRKASRARTRDGARDQRSAISDRRSACQLVSFPELAARQVSTGIRSQRSR